MITRLEPGGDFAPINLATLGGGSITLGVPSKPENWQAIFSYRGKHCPICTRFLGELNAHVEELAKAGIEVVAVSGDTQERAAKHMEEAKPTFPIAFGLQLETMRTLGLYISEPAPSDDIDEPFGEPGLFVVDGTGRLIVVNYSNASVARPNLGTLTMGLSFLKGHNYPIRGTQS